MDKLRLARDGLEGPKEGEVVEDPDCDPREGNDSACGESEPLEKRTELKRGELTVPRIDEWGVGLADVVEDPTA